MPRVWIKLFCTIFMNKNRPFLFRKGPQYEVNKLIMMGLSSDGLCLLLVLKKSSEDD